MKKYVEVIMKEALKAYKKNEIPVGCVVVKNNKIVSKAHNTKQKSHKCINHAEILAIIKAEKKLKDWRLDNCELYVTLEPCDMCMEVIRQCRIKKVFYLLKSNYVNEKNKKIDKELIENFPQVQADYQIKLCEFFASKR